MEKALIDVYISVKQALCEYTLTLREFKCVFEMNLEVLKRRSKNVGRLNCYTRCVHVIAHTWCSFLCYG